jgi:sec-independent protein translocase protein TatA
MNIPIFEKKKMHSILLSIGTGEVFMIIFIALILFGPKRIPEVARHLGKGVREFNRMKNEISKEIAKDETSFIKDIKEIKDTLDKPL